MKKFAHKISPDEDKSLNNWANESGEDAQYIEEMTRLWQQTTQPTDVSVFNSQKAWSKVLSKTSAPEAKVVEMSFVRWTLAAACMAGVIAVGYLLFDSISGNNNTTIIVKTRQNEKRKISLPDSSKVWLNENSELSYTEEFLKDSIRRVTLKGEAFFEVTHNPQRPFLVEGNGLVTRVLGTSFNLKYTEAQRNLVVVAGKVRFSYFEKTAVKSSIVIEAGHQTELHNGKFVVGEEIDKNKLAWHTGVLEFQNQSLDYVVQNLTSLYNTSIDLKAMDIKDIKYTGLIDHLPIEVALETICFPLDLRWKKTSTGYLITNN